jgi:hypothetical protein
VQESWKAPLSQFIEHLYLKRFGRERPESVMPVEKRARPSGFGTKKKEPAGMNTDEDVYRDIGCRHGCP